MDINGASAVVTGGASGIGAATARQLAAKGARVVVADLQADKGEALAKEIGGVFVTVDVTNTDQIIDAVKTAADLGPLRALVNSAGIGWAQRTIGKDGEFSSAHDLDAYKKVLEINLVGTFDCIRIAATQMSKNDFTETGERGAIVNMTSVAAFDGQIGQAAYSSSKGGVVGPDAAGRARPVGRRRPREHRRPRPDRHPDLRRGRGLGGVQGQARRVRAVPAPAGQARRVGLAWSSNCSPTPT